MTSMKIYVLMDQEYKISKLPLRLAMCSTGCPRICRNKNKTFIRLCKTVFCQKIRTGSDIFLHEELSTRYRFNELKDLTSVTRVVETKYISI